MANDKQEYQRRQALMEEATRLGVTFRNNVTTDELEEKIKAERQAQGIPENQPKKLSKDAPVVKANLTEYRNPTQLRNIRVRQAERLIRVRITCMNPVKSLWQGEIFTFGNDNMTIKRMVPFERETHVEQAILGIIEARKYRVPIRPKKGRSTNKMEVVLVPEFSVERLGALHQEELKDLAAQQAAAKR